MTHYYTLCLATKTMTIIALVALFSKDAIAISASDCSAGHTDSTCADKLIFHPPPPNPVVTLFQGKLDTGPYVGNEYWGWDFVTASSIGRDNLVPTVFVNRSSQAVTFTFSTKVPTNAACPHDCIPGYEFQLGEKRKSQYPTPSTTNGQSNLIITIPAGESYAWIIGMKNSPQPMIVTVTVPLDIGTTLSDVGLPTNLDIANPVAPQALTCPCSDGTLAPCSIGTHFSSGLISLYSKTTGATPPDAYNECLPER